MESLFDCVPVSAVQKKRRTHYITVEKEVEVTAEVDLRITIDDLNDEIIFDYIDNKMTIEQLFEGLSERDQNDLYDFLKMRGRI